MKRPKKIAISSVISTLVIATLSLSVSAKNNTQKVLPDLPFPVTANATLVLEPSNHTEEQSSSATVLTFLGLTENSEKKLELVEIGAQFPKLTMVSTQSVREKNSDQTSEQKDATPRFTLNLDIIPDTELSTQPPSEQSISTDFEDSVNQPDSNTAANVEANDASIANDIVELKQQEFKGSDWQPLPVVPSLNKFKGRFATAATQVNGIVYLLGGYSNNQVQRPAFTPNLQNRSDFYAYDPATQQYSLLEDLPVAVDDTTLVTYRDRYIYALSGWHKEGAVNLVQVFDTFKNEWFQASPLPINGVFGHAAGILDNTILMCDGASMQQQFATASRLTINQRCLIGEIDVTNPSLITWQEWAHPGDSGRFRMAAISDVNTDQICFVGGATELYNLNGMNAKGTAVEGTTEVWCYQASNRTWQISDAPEPSYDHKSAFIFQNKVMTLGGRNKSGIISHAIVHKTFSNELIESPNSN
ncbi:hypothetical protein J1N51_04470 [Psychrosphaera ytuae]|uniref:Galactose oxidase n=1 Tax=Psychrosphaera ytuae TaxID=2820710 RepID=A0A975HJ06_9GAMM|nr:kelch repeat-containing protein [Psychrosphaera ytuae]QTH64723.1 hypothetical protein J1N51_04470 [Psychrosphaera ytuae]